MSVPKTASRARSVKRIARNISRIVVSGDNEMSPKAGWEATSPLLAIKSSSGGPPETWEPKSLVVRQRKTCHAGYLTSELVFDAAHARLITQEDELLLYVETKRLISVLKRRN